MMSGAEGVLQGIAAGEVAVGAAGVATAASAYAVIGNYPIYLSVGGAVGASTWSVIEEVYSRAPRFWDALNMAWVRAQTLTGRPFLVAYETSSRLRGKGLSGEISLLERLNYVSKGIWYVR
jgi:hypothetical protein